EGTYILGANLEDSTSGSLIYQLGYGMVHDQTAMKFVYAYQNTTAQFWPTTFPLIIGNEYKFEIMRGDLYPGFTANDILYKITNITANTATLMRRNAQEFEWD